uniref:ARID DNA-binding domain-containing protein n=1 Tax=Tanacetum cinerariifolium TaxID=118510 RepID=A0A6L2P4G0_TANCI|nr:ARID DNA-binding domain-containing protein [Tanacetum cinerariifolium]
MLKKQIEEILQYNNTLNQPQSTNNAQNKYKNYKRFQCKQLGYIVKSCPMDDNNGDMVTKTDSSNLARGKKEGFKTTKPIVMLKYPESIHFSTTCMIKGTDHVNWDDICFDKNGGQVLLVPGVHYTPEVTLNILSIDILEKQGSEIKYEGNRCTLVYMFSNKENHKFDEDRMRTLQNKYLEDYFESMTKKDEGMREDLIRIKGNLYSTKVQTFNEYVVFLNLIKQDNIVDQEWDFFRNRVNKTVRAPQQEYNGGDNQPILKKPTREIEEGKDRNCLMSHQWDFGETGASIGRFTVLKGKGKLKHFGVKLEDTEEGKDSQEQPILSHSTKAHNLQGMDLGPSTSRILDKEDSCNSTSDEFIIIT